MSAAPHRKNINSAEDQPQKHQVHGEQTPKTPNLKSNVVTKLRKPLVVHER